MSALEDYLEFLEEIDVELLAVYALGKLNNPLGKEMVEQDLKKFEELKEKANREIYI